MLRSANCPAAALLRSVRLPLFQAHAELIGLLKLPMKVRILRLSNVPGHIDRVFKIVNALFDVPMFENMAEADEYFLEIQKPNLKNFCLK